MTARSTRTPRASPATGRPRRPAPPAPRTPRRRPGAKPRSNAPSTTVWSAPSCALPPILGAGPTSNWGTRVPERIRDGQGPPIAPDGNWGWVHVDDLVAALLAGVDADAEVVRGLTVNVVAGHVPYGTYRDAVAAIVGGAPDPGSEHGPAWNGRYATRRLSQTLDVTLDRTFDDAMAEIADAWRRRTDA